MKIERSQEVAAWDSRLEEYLLDQAGPGGGFVKSRHVASAMNVSSKKVGSAMYRLMHLSSDIKIEKWGGSSDGMTYYIEPTSEI